jgi:hypothetical protein
MQIVANRLEQSYTPSDSQHWSSSFQRPHDLFTRGARNFEDKHGIGITGLIREVFDSPTGVSAGMDGRWALRVALDAFTQLLLTDRGPDLLSLSNFDYDSIPPRREFRLSVQISHLGRPPALPIDC